MRYKIETSSDALIPVSNGDGAMVLAILLGMLIGAACVYLGWKGKQLWLKVWGAGLVLASCVYILYVAW